MRVIGKIKFDAPGAAALAGVTATIIPHAVWTGATRAKPASGDLFWVQEPFVEFIDKKSGIKTEIIFGSILTAKRPDWYARQHELNRSCRVHAADMLTQRSSRYTLEVLSHMPDGALQCAVHAEQISTYIERVSA